MARLSRFRVLAAGLVLELCGGSIYIVSLYLHEVQAKWFPSDTHSLDKVESLAFACNLGNWIPLGGFFYDSRIGGPKRTVVIACILTLVGYGGLYLCSVDMPVGGYSGTNIWLLRLLWFAWGHGSGYFDCACIATTAYNFPRERGAAMGVVKALYGLSGAILTQPYLCFFAQPGGAPAFLAFLAIGLSALGICAMPFVAQVRFTPSMMQADRPAERLRYAFVVILVLALALATAGILRSLKLGSAALSYTMLGVSVAGVFALLTVAYGGSVASSSIGADTREATQDTNAASLSSSLLAARGDDQRYAQHVADRSCSCSTPPINDACSVGPPSAGAAAGVVATEAEEAAPNHDDGQNNNNKNSALASLTNESVWMNLRTLNFWLLFVAFFAGTGGGIVFTNHVEYIVSAQLGPHGDAKSTSDALISLFSVCNCLGRLGAGLGSDALRKYLHRPSWFAAATALMGLSHALLLGARFTGLVYAAAVCAGVSYGAFWALQPTLVGELFGLKAFASTYNAYTPAVSGASLILSAQLASRVAEAHTPLPPPPPPGMPPSPPPPCYGDSCYRITHLVIIGLCGLGVLTTAVMSLRTRAFYNRRLKLLDQ